MSTIIWLSDLHFLAQGHVLGHDPRTRLSAAINRINADHSDAVICVISGDLVDQATQPDYAALALMLSNVQMPCLAMVGNHDDRTLLRDAFALPDTTMPGFVQYRVDLPDISVLCLDTLKPGADGGAFCAERLEWLDDQLSSTPDMRTILFMHHPPMPLGLPMQDADNLADGATFLDLLTAHPNVHQLCIGHVHRPISGVIRGVPFATLHSTLYQSPPSQPKWNWSSFAPSHEAPSFARIEVDADSTRLHNIQFCAADHGRDKGVLRKPETHSDA